MNLYTPLLTDLYQLTMAYGYFQLNMHEQNAAFHLLFRKNPFHGNYALSCGLGSVIEYLNHWHIQEDDLAYLSTLKNTDQTPLFSEDFLAYLAQLTLSCDIDAVPEGMIVFPHAPLLRIEGPLLQCQLLETILLNLINFQTLIATKATRVCQAAGQDKVIEFGMRRAQGPDGALSASRAAYIGGCVGTSNTLAGKLFDIPVSGTHAHAWVSAFESEPAAFSAYAKVMPKHCILLVDTYHTLQGVKNAIEIGKQLRLHGNDLLGIRLDSGDLAALSVEARALLDEAGFKNTTILASNSLDEYVIQNLKQQGAAIDCWGVGTHLITAYDYPALDGVYKLSALCNQQGLWEYKLKLSEQEVKISNPGRHQVRRFFYGDHYMSDVIYDLSLGIADTPSACSLEKPSQTKKLDNCDAFVDLLQPIYRKGRLVYQTESIHEIRKRAMTQVQHFHSTHGTSAYPVLLEKNLHDLKEQLVNKMSPHHHPLSQAK